MPPISRTVFVKLYAPSVDKSVKGFELKQSTTYSAILKSIRTALGDVSQAWPYNARRAPIEDFTVVKKGQNLLIATDYFEEPLATKLKDVLIVQPGAAETAWMALSPAQKYIHIMYLRRSSRSSIPPIYLTLPLVTVQTLIKEYTTNLSSSSSALAFIAENWDLPIDAVLGFQGMVMPYGEMKSWDNNLLPALAILSAATVAQGHAVSKLIVETVKQRSGNVVEVEDVLEVGKKLYRRAIG